MMGFRATLGRSWPVLLAYGLFSVWGVTCLVASLALTKGGFGISPGELGAVVGVLVATVVGHVVGNLLGLTGLRLLPVVLMFTVLLIGASLTGLAIGPFAVFLVIGVVAAFGGYLGIASRLDVVAAWYPLSFCVGGAIVWMNHHGALETFQGGSKHALWDGFTMVCLTGGVFLMLVFLATRHSLGLTVWQEIARPRGVNLDPSESVAVARPGRGSFFVLFAFTLVVLGATALVSPYLFRTQKDDAKQGEASGKDGDAAKGKQGQGAGGSAKGTQGAGEGQQGQGDESADSKDQRDGEGTKGEGKEGEGAKGKSGLGKGRKSGQGKTGQGKTGQGTSGQDKTGLGKSGQGKSGQGKSGQGKSGQGKSGQGGEGGEGGEGGDDGDDGEGGDDGEPLGAPDTEGAGQAASGALDLGLKLFLWLLVFAILLLLLLTVAFPPIRRAFLLRHLDRPLWPVAPTARVMNLWRRALSVLAMLDIEPNPGEAPRDFARRAEGEVRTLLHCESPGLRDAASIVETIDYAGRGLGAGDEQTMRQAVNAFVGTVDPRIAFGKRFASAWGRPPEVET